MTSVAPRSPTAASTPARTITMPRGLRRVVVLALVGMTAGTPGVAGAASSTAPGARQVSIIKRQLEVARADRAKACRGAKPARCAVAKRTERKLVVRLRAARAAATAPSSSGSRSAAPAAPAAGGPVVAPSTPAARSPQATMAPAPAQPPAPTQAVVASVAATTPTTAAASTSTQPTAVAQTVVGSVAATTPMMTAVSTVTQPAAPAQTVAASVAATTPVTTAVSATTPPPATPPTLVTPQASAVAAPTRTLYVSASGSDAGSGDAANPFATLTAALARADGGERIVVGPGNYPAVTDSRDRSSWVTVEGSGAVRIAGLEINGARWLSIGGVTFTAGVMIREYVARGLTRTAAHIDLHDVEFTGPGTCARARNGSTDVTIRSSWFHDCMNGFGAPAGGGIPQSRGLTLAGNRFVHLTGDAIQVGQWDDIRITGNVIDDVRDPARVYHNDGIQLTGNTRGAVISNNRISNSRTQLIFVQDAVGPIDDVTIENNLLLGAGAVAMQIRGATRARVVGNTVWGGKDGGFWLATDPTTTAHPYGPATDTVVVNNVLQNFMTYNDARASVAGGNVIPCAPRAEITNAAKGTTCVSDMGFTDVAAGALQLSPTSPARRLGSPLQTLATDIDGWARGAVMVPGAFR